MPVLRYFAFVGAALMALLFVVGWELPAAAPAAEAANTGTDLSSIRIHSDRKWPERVVFDTNAPAIVSAQTANAVPAAAAPQQVADASAKVTARDAFAQANPVDLKKPDVKPLKRKIARRHVAPPPGQPTMLIAQRPQPFGLFGLN